MLGHRPWSAGSQHHRPTGDRLVPHRHTVCDDPPVTALWLVARRISGATRGSIVLLVVLIAITAGFVELSVSAARRTESSFDRFVEWADPPTVVTGGAPDEIGAIGDHLSEITSLPGVEDWARMEAVDVTSIELADGRRTGAPRLNV